MEAWPNRACHQGQKQSKKKTSDEETCLSGYLPRTGANMVAILRPLLLLYATKHNRMHSLTSQRYPSVCGGGMQSSPDRCAEGQHQMHDRRSWLLNLGKTGSMQGAIWEAKAADSNREAWCRSH